MDLFAFDYFLWGDTSFYTYLQKVDLDIVCFILGITHQPVKNL